MTTIITDGNYLIADHRTSIDARHSRDNRLGHIDAFESDTSIKILLPNDITYKDRKGEVENIRAVALSGDTTISDNNHLLVLERTKSLNDFIALCLANLMLRGEGVTITCLTDKGNMIRIAADNYSTVVTTHLRGRLTPSGTGATYRFMPGVDKAFREKKLSLLEVFQFCVVCDPHSSLSYSVYGLEENTLYTKVTMTNEELISNYNKVMEISNATTLQRLNAVPMK